MYSHNHCCHGKAASIKYSECLSAALVMQHAKCMRHITLSPVPIWIYHVLLHYFINNTIFGKKLLNIKCVFLFSLQLLPEIFLILHRIQQDIIINIYRSSCKVPFIVRFYRALPCRQAGQQTDEVNSHFPQFCKSGYKLKALNLNTVPIWLEPLVLVWIGTQWMSSAVTSLTMNQFSSKCQANGMWTVI